MRGGTILLAAGLFLPACNMTSSMPMPVVSEPPLIELDQRPGAQASFALSKVIATIRRGTVIAHFPAGGVAGVEGHLCNYRHAGESTLEWAAGSSGLGDWRSELGEVFYHALSTRGLRVAGDPGDLFGQDEAASSAEHLIGARVTEIRGNFCQSHHWWDGRPLEEFSGEMFVAVEWTVFSSLLQRELLTLRTEGYYKQVQPKRDGVVVAFHEAFAAAAEHLLGAPEFVAVAERRTAAPEAGAEAGTGAGTGAAARARRFTARALSARPLDGRIDEPLPAVVTVRRGARHGSGFVISEDGLVLTNQHVVGDAERVGIVLNNGLEAIGEVLARSAARDAAVVRVGLRVPSYLPLRTALPTPAERVYAIGTPLDPELDSTVTTGVVSAVRKDPRTGLTMIQSDAAISPGNSGGPLLDARGNVIGISAAQVLDAERRAQGLNLFIPIGAALEALNLRPRPAPS